MNKKSVLVSLIILLSLALSYCVLAQENLTITTYYPSPFGSYNQLSVRTRADIGETKEGYAGVWSGGGMANAWGARLFFSGAQDITAGGYNNENSDLLFMTRYNVALDNSELRTVIGDDGSPADAFTVGYIAYSTSSWVENFRVNSAGDVSARRNIFACHRMSYTATSGICMCGDWNCNGNCLETGESCNYAIATVPPAGIKSGSTWYPAITIRYPTSGTYLCCSSTN